MVHLTPATARSWRDGTARRRMDGAVAIGGVADDPAGFIDNLASDRP